MMRCWCGYLSGAKCKLFAYADASVIAIVSYFTETQNDLPFGYLPVQVDLERGTLKEHLSVWKNSLRMVNITRSI